MRQIIELTEKDIIQIIANTYDVDCNQVNLLAMKQWEGQGSMEHEVCRAKATITLKEG